MGLEADRISRSFKPLHREAVAQLQEAERLHVCLADVSYANWTSDKMVTGSVWS